MNLVQFDTSTELMTPVLAVASGPAVNAPVTTGANGLIDPSLLPISGSNNQNRTQQTVSSNYSMLGTDGAIWADATNGSFNVILPDATTVAGSSFLVKKIDSSAHTVTIVGGPGQTIDGYANKILSTPDAFLRMQSNGQTWYIIGTSASIVEVSNQGSLNQVTGQGSIVVDLALGTTVYIVLTGDVGSSSFINPQPNMAITVFLIQDGAGQHSFTWPTNVKNGGPVSPTDGNAAPNTILVQNFTYLSQAATFYATTLLSS